VKRTWKIQELFGTPLPPGKFRMRQVAARWPAATVERVRRSWRAEIERFCAKLGPRYRIHPSQAPWPSVYRGRTRILWPGRVFALRAIERNSALTFHLAPVNFAWITAGVPRAHIFGIVTFAITSDRFIILTLRGDRANVYPGSLHGNGGNPDRIESVEEHQIRETEEEIGVRRSEIVRDSMRFGGIGTNLIAPLPGKPVLSGWLHLSIPARKVIRRVRAVPVDDRPGDAVDVQAVKLDAPAVDSLLKRRDVCPSALAGLAILKHHLLK
jgi:8-oxo-dGTP pyrophosphatase MutT (NUDIX family)